MKSVNEIHINCLNDVKNEINSANNIIDLLTDNQKQLSSEVIENHNTFSF